MNRLRDAIVDTLKGKFPSMEHSIAPFIGLLDEQSDSQISYAAPGILVCILPVTEVPDAIAPWEMQVEMGLVIAVKEASALERDKAGWALSSKVIDVVYRNTWGIPTDLIRPAIVVNWAKNTARDAQGVPTGINYWTIQFYNWVKIEALL